MTEIDTLDASTIVDMEQIKAEVEAHYIRVGFGKVNRDGETVVDDDAFKKKVFETIASRPVTGKPNKSSNAWTQGELLAAVFPGAPGTDPNTSDQLTEAENLVRSTLVRKCWNLTNPNRTGYVQKRLDEVGTMVLCRAKIMRGLDEINGSYVTDDPDLIMGDSVAPKIESLVNEANNLRAHAQMITSRHPELEDRVAAAISSGVKRTQAALPKPTSTNGSRPQIAAPATPFHDGEDA
jgi:hypothetical protein